MSTVLWANRLIGDSVESQEADLLYLYRHLGRLDKLSRKLDVAALSSLCDDTDLRVNLEQLELPESMESTDALMARDGCWVPADSAVALLEVLATHVRDVRPKFGLLKNDCEGVIEDLGEALAYARESSERSARFNFSIVM